MGRVIDARYRVQSRIGTGGMGAVYRVEHLRLGKVAAMKVLHRDLATDAEAVRRFRREAEAVSRLNHPNIVQTFDFGLWEGLLYLIMEYVKGDDLGAIVKRDGPLPLARALPLFAQVCSALDEAEHLGVVHRDLKPDNIVCLRRRDQEHAKVLDFGLAKLRERPGRSSIGPWEGRASLLPERSPSPDAARSQDAGEITGTGHLVGTPYYMSPEQVRSEAVDHRSDIYSLGATLYRVVTGCHAFEGSTPVGILTKHLTDDLVPPSRRAPDRNLPPEIDRIVLRAMARQREDRYTSAVEMRDDLQAALGPGGGPPRPSGAYRPLRATLNTGAAAQEILPLEELSPDSEGIVRLRREDFDAFERAQARRRKVTLVAGPVLLGVLALAGWMGLRSLRPRPVSNEVEPNDTPAGASLLPRGKPVSGKVGDPHAGGEPDFDYYRIPAASEPRAVSARITGIPGVDLVLELYDGKGERQARADGARAGGGEAFGPVALAPGEGYVRARPLWTAGQTAQPGSTVPYVLTVDWGPPRRDLELEPNDAPELANLVDPEQGIEGHLSAPEDEDWYRVVVPPGSYADAEVEGIDGIDLVVMLGAERKRADTAGVGEDEEVEATAGPDGVVLVGVGEQPAAAAGRKPVPEARRDESYTIKVRFRPLARRGG